MVGTHSAKMMEVSCKQFRKAVAAIVVAVLMHTCDKIKASYDIIIGSTTLFFDTYDGMMTSVIAVPSKALFPIDFTPLRKTLQ